MIPRKLSFMNTLAPMFRHICTALSIHAFSGIILSLRFPVSAPKITYSGSQFFLTLSRLGSCAGGQGFSIGSQLWKV